MLSSLESASNKIEFVPLREEHIPLLRLWLKEPHVSEFWQETEDEEQFRQKFLSKLPDRGVAPFIIQINSIPVGYIQHYEARKVGGGWWPDADEGTFGIDQFIGEASLIGQGIGTKIIKTFVDHLFLQTTVNEIITDPDPRNTRAIRAYEKVGFKALGKISTPGGDALLMRLEKAFGPTSIETDAYLKKWNLSSAVHLVTTKTSQIYRVVYQGSPAILKILNPLGEKFEATSPQVLRCFDGNGSARILTYDEGALLLEYVDGTKLAALVADGQDQESAHIICDVLDRLHSYSGPVPTGVHDLKRQFQSLFLRAKDSNSDPIFQKTARVAEDLLSTESHKRLLHGDIHHTNILKSSSRGWLAIDPRGVFGERTYDVANSFFNPDSMPELVETKSRIESIAEIFSERLKVDKRRILEFAYAHGGLSSSWQLEDGENPQRRLLITSVIEMLL